MSVSIRPSWFYHEREDSKVKSLSELVRVYFQSVGCNSSLLLNVSPDKRGVLCETDVTRLKEFGEYLEKMYAKDFVSGGPGRGLPGREKVKNIPWGRDVR